jgi:AcrR family transcriptional regulator
MTQLQPAVFAEKSIVRRMNGDDRRKQILRVAQHVFAEHNYHGATMARIAKAAGVTEPTIYLHFPSKQDLFIAVCEDCSRFEIESVKRAMESTHNVLDGYRLIFQQLHHFTSRINPDPAKVLIINKVVTDPEIKAVVRRCNQRLYSLVTDYIRREMKAGKIRKDVEPEVMARIMVSTIREMISMLIIGAVDDFDKYFKKTGDYIVRLIRQREENACAAKEA